MTDDIRGRAKRGIKLLLGRQVALQILSFSGGVVLARILEPADLGLYSIATVLVGAFALFGDFGLAASFIQRRAEFTERDLRVGFTLQQVVTTVIVAALFMAAPWLASLYPSAARDTAWLVRALALNLYLSSWRTASALQLERQLCYERLAWTEVAEILSYQGTAVALAVAGFHAWSFVWATLVSGLLGTVLVYIAAPWQIGFAFDSRTVREIVRFGVPFQLANIANQSEAWMGPTLVARLAGPQAVGFLAWGLSNGRRPLILTSNVMRVAFPHFSRVQEEPGEVERLVTRYLTYLLLPAGLWFAAMLTAGASLVQWVYTDKWLPAVPALILCSAGVNAEVMGWVGGVGLMSLGKVGTATRLVLFRSLLTITLSVPLVLWIGFTGVPLAAMIAAALVMPRVFNGLEAGGTRRVLRSVAWLLIPLIASISAGSGTSRLWTVQPLHGLLSFALTTAAYLVVAVCACPHWLRETIGSRLPAPLSVCIRAWDRYLIGNYPGMRHVP
jgi:O-antigen/teichoic acid export membrane protein